MGGRRKGAGRGKEVGREGVFDRSRGPRLSRRRRCRRHRRHSQEASRSFVEDLMVQLRSRWSWNRLLWDERRRREEEEMEDEIETRRPQRLRRRELPTRRD